MKRLLLLLVLATVAGCDDQVSPTVGLDVPFSLYGYLDPTADRQAIRVVPIADRIDSDPDVIDAAVSSTDLETGVTTAWRDSLVTFADGSRGHVFVADLTPRPGSVVEVEARRSDGAASRATVVVPEVVEPRVGQALFVDGGIGYRVEVAGARRVLEGTLRVVVGGYPGDAPGTTRRLEVPVRAQPRETAPGVWSVDVPFVTATRALLQSLGVLDAGLGLVSLEYATFIVGDDWDPPSTDPDALAEPGVFSNVEGGLGFLGAGYATSVRWAPGLDATAAAGFRVAADRASELSINEVMPGEGGWVEFYNPTLADVPLRGYTLAAPAGEDGAQPLPVAASVPPRGFYVVDLEAAAARVAVYNRTGELVLEADPLPLGAEAGAVSYGSYPDGYSLRVRQPVAPRVEAIYDVFRGALRPTRGAPNELGLEVAFANEVYTEGTRGWVETVTVLAGVDSVTVISEGVPPGALRPVASPAIPTGAAGLAVADEQDPGLVLPQTGGAVIVLALYRDPRVVSTPDSRFPILDPAVQLRAVDYRPFGVQTPGRSEGYLPGAPGGTWTTGLRPTRGAPNAPARRAF